jgi:hypothetical protein
VVHLPARLLGLIVGRVTHAANTIAIPVQLDDSVRAEIDYLPCTKSLSLWTRTYKAECNKRSMIIRNERVTVALIVPRNPYATARSRYDIVYGWRGIAIVVCSELAAQNIASELDLVVSTKLANPAIRRFWHDIAGGGHDQSAEQWHAAKPLSHDPVKLLHGHILH